MTPLTALSLSLTAFSPSFATPSESLYKADEDVFDDWQICRTRASGPDGFYQLSEGGFRPIIALESLGENADRAYRLGEQFAAQYPDQVQRAEEIFRFVRDRVQYIPDVDQFQYEEFAQNADELALEIEQKGLARGDCEDSAVLLAVTYKGAGYRSAIALATGHTASLVYLPEHRLASALEIEGEPGWVWAEATGRNNHLGWVPDRYKGERLAAYEITVEAMAIEEPPPRPKTTIPKTGGGGIPLLGSPFLGVIWLMWMVSLLGGRRRRH